MNENSRIERIADNFDEAWQKGEEPSLQNFIGSAEQQPDRELLERLLPIDIEYRVKNGEDVKASDYDKFGSNAEKLAQKRLTKMLLSESEGHAAPIELSTTQGHDTEQQYRQIGHYKLLQTIYEGGMGIVWMAEQEEPIRRRVALKLIKPGLSTKEFITRFEAERQAIAMMDHPNIAKILDAGTTDEGSPFFVMELIKGVPLNDYCDEHELSVRDRLQIMIDVCDATQHAHQKGILHRDLKPLNVLVSEADKKPVPKIIDFGLAKAMEHTTKLTDKTMHTEFGRVLGTVQYMSPEQAKLKFLDIDTRTDIYSLGVMLYELLVGSTPLEKDAIADKDMLEVLDLIREKVPQRPSTRLNLAEDKSVEISRRREIAPSKLQKILKGELDWIVMKAIEKDRNRRYESAAGFADDIQRYLDNEAVEARPPSTSYLISKFVQKNLGLVGAIATIAILLIASVCVSSVFAIEANSAKNREIEQREIAEDQKVIADKQRVEAEAQKVIADKQRLEAEEQTAISETVLNFFQTNLLRQANIYEQANDGFGSFVKKELTVAEALAKSAVEFSPENIETKFRNQPKIQASVLETMADTFSSIDKHKIAIKLSSASLSIREKFAKTAGTGQFHASQIRHVFILLKARKNAESVVISTSVLKGLLDILDMSNRPLSSDQKQVLSNYSNLDSFIDCEITLVIDALAKRLSPELTYVPPMSIDDLPVKDYPRTFFAVLNALAYVPKLHIAIQERYSDSDDRTTYILLVSAFIDHFYSKMEQKFPSGRFSSKKSIDDAIRKYKKVYDFCDKNVDKNGPKLAGLNMLLGYAYRDKYGKLDSRVLKCFRASSALCHENLPSGHPAMVLADNHLANAYFLRDRFLKALPLFKSVAKRRRQMLGTGDRETLYSIVCVGRCHYQIAKTHGQKSKEYAFHFKCCIAEYREACGLLVNHFGAVDAQYSSAQSELTKILNEVEQ